MFTWNGRLVLLAQEKLYSESQVYFQAWPKFDKAADEKGFSPMLAFISQRWSIYSTTPLLANTTTTSTTINLRKFSVGQTATPHPAQPQPKPQPQPQPTTTWGRFQRGQLSRPGPPPTPEKPVSRYEVSCSPESNEASFQMRSHFSDENEIDHCKNVHQHLQTSSYLKYSPSSSQLSNNIYNQSTILH